MLSFFSSTRLPDEPIFNADLAVHKLDLKKDNACGVYQLEAISEPTYFTQYIDKIDDLDKVLNSAQYQAFAKSYLTYGEWRMPDPLGHKLEIIPLTDLSNLHPGDMIEVEVLFGR